MDSRTKIQTSPSDMSSVFLEKKKKFYFFFKQKSQQSGYLKYCFKRQCFSVDNFLNIV